MNTIEFKNKVAEILTDFDIDKSDSGCIFGTKNNNSTKMFRDNEKTLIKSTGIRHVFISSRMYPNTDKDFRYAMIYTIAKARGYRCKNWYKMELDKVFISDENDNVLLEKIRNEFK